MAAKEIGILADSTADFPEGLVEKLGIEVIPIHINIDGEDFLHGVDISNQEVTAALKEDHDIKTSPPMPSEYADRFEAMASRYRRIISLHVSSELSNCYKSASSSMRILFDETAARITLLDTRNVSVGMGMIVKKAVALSKKHQDPVQLVDSLKPLMKNNLLLFTVENLYWLKRAGKLTVFSSLVGSFLNVKPVIRLEDGRLTPVRKYRGRQPAVDEMIRMARQEHARYGLRQDIWIAHADASEEAARVREALLDVSADMRTDVKMMEVGPTIAAHTGPGCMVLGMMRR